MRVLLMILLMSTNVFAGERPTIEIRAYNSIIDKTVITLSELVDMSSVQDGSIIEQFKKIVLGDAPSLGEQRIYTSSHIAEAIRKGLASKDWNVKIPHRIIVENRGHEVSREAITQELLSKWNKSCGVGCEVQIKSMQLPVLPTALANTPWTLEHDGQLPKGSYSARLNFSKPDGRPVYYWVSGQAIVRKLVPVLTRRMAPGSRLQKDDFHNEWRDVTFATDTAADGKQIIGQQVTYMMNSGDILWRSSISREKAIRRGEIVKVVVGEGSWQITTQAVAEQDGYVGDTVNFKNTQSNKIISGRVVGSGEVEIQ